MNKLDIICHRKKILCTITYIQYFHYQSSDNRYKKMNVPYGHNELYANTVYLDKRYVFSIQIFGILDTGEHLIKDTNVDFLG